jgi:hypothetical protein
VDIEKVSYLIPRGTLGTEDKWSACASAVCHALNIAHGMAVNKEFFCLQRLAVQWSVVVVALMMMMMMMMVRGGE